MKRRLKAYKKTVSIVDESTIALYESLGREKKGFLMESNDKENGRYTFMGVEPEALIQSDGESLVITKADGTKEVRRGNPLERLKEYYSEFEIVKEDGELEFTGGLVGSLDMILSAIPRIYRTTMKMKSELKPFSLCWLQSFWQSTM